MKRALKDLCRSFESEPVAESATGREQRSEGGSAHLVQLRFTFPDPRSIRWTEGFPPMVCQGLDVFEREARLGVLRMEPKAGCDRETPVRNVVNEGMVETEGSVDRVDVSEMRKAPKGAGDFRRVTLRQEGRSAHVECLADHRRGLE
jgi:hypothetical protein